MAKTGTSAEMSFRSVDAAYTDTHTRTPWDRPLQGYFSVVCSPRRHPRSHPRPRGCRRVRRVGESFSLNSE